MQRKITTYVNNKEVVISQAKKLLKEYSSNLPTVWPLVGKLDGTNFKIHVFPKSFDGETKVVTQIAINIFKVDSEEYFVIVGA